jgi:NitT/TauT family transport system permease protein
MSVAETTPQIQVPVLPDDAPRVYVRPSLNRDLAGFMTALFIIVTYHIQHPTLLFRAQFGRSFRDDGLQEGVVIMLVISTLFLIGSLSTLWEGRNSPIGRLKLAFTAILTLFTVHGILMVYGSTNLFQSLYDASPALLEEVFKEGDLLPFMKASNTAAILGGAAFMSALCLWSPWNRLRAIRSYERGIQWTEFLYDLAAVVVLVLIVATYHIQNPLLLANTSLGDFLISNNTDAPRSPQFASAWLLVTTSLLFFAPNLRRGNNDGTGAFKTAMILVISLYVIHILLVIVGNDNFFMNYYNVTPEGYQVLLDGDNATKVTFLALDRAGFFAGMALIAALYLWSPWERLNLYNEAIQNNIVPIGIALVTLTLWEGIIELFNIKQFLLPRPSVIWVTLLDEYPKMIAAGWFTFLNAFKGFVIGCGLGFLTGVASARYAKFSAAILPLAIAANAVPIIAFAPIANNWFGVTNASSKIAIVAVLCYFPAMISTVRGLTSVDMSQLELMRSYAAREIDIFRWLRFPNALPFIFSALKLATTLSMIGAIVSEFFGGSLAGLGYRIRNDAQLFRYPESWSAIIIASAFGISFFLLISALERAAMPWYRSFRSES